MKGGANPRVSSPEPGFSILITSAPRSASICTQVGPASTRVRSNTLTSLSGPVGSVIRHFFADRISNHKGLAYVICRLQAVAARVVHAKPASAALQRILWQPQFCQM